MSPVWWLALLAGLATLPAMWRLLRGPAAADRVVALDLLFALAVAFCLLVESLPPADQQDSPLPAAPLGPFLQTLCRYERLRIQLAWGLADYGNPFQEILPFPVISLKAKLEHMEEGWPELIPGRVRVTLFKVPMLPAVTVREESLDDRTSSPA